MRIQEFLQPENSWKLGFLLGDVSDDVIVISSCRACKENENLSIKYVETQQQLPGGLKVSGVFFTTTQSVNVSLIHQFCQKNISNHLKDLISTDFVVVCAVLEECKSLLQENVFLYSLRNGEVHSTQVKIQPQEKDYITFRVTADLPLQLIVTAGTDLTQLIVCKTKLLKQLIESERVVFHVQNSHILLDGGQDDESTHRVLDHNAIATDIMDHIEDEVKDSFSLSKGKKKRKTINEQVVDVSLMLRMTQSPEQTTTPVAYHKTGLSHHVILHLPINALVHTVTTTAVLQLPHLFVDSVCTQLGAMATCMQQYSEKEICIPRPFHFQPWGCDQFVTIVYPDGKSDAELESVRKTLHQMLLLPLDRPLLRKCNAFHFQADKKGDVYLENTHVGLQNAGSDGSKVCLVQGTYTYHHYMQDKFNDDHWGCAYRSLQTIVSWFRHQGYTDAHVPSHKAIQQALVDAGDKDAKFVGSTKWIGSIEVCTVLNQLLGVTSKIMIVNAGSELANKGRELVQHFQTQGTPIMIGGGVLAHTILGADFNDKSGAIRFLILDPHYKGAEDIKVIQDKGWCGWKGVDFWDQNVFYNLCLPLRPEVI